MGNVLDDYRNIRLDPDLINLIRTSGQIFRPVHFAKKEHIYVGGGGNNIFLIECGRVKVSMQTQDGRACNLGIYSVDQTFGESGLSGQRSAETATALNDCVVRRVQVPVLLSVMQDRQLLAMFTQHLASKLANYQAVISDFVTNNSEQRLASTILRLAKSLGTHDSGMIRVRERISYQDLSEMVGTTRSRVGFFMSEFSKLGMIKDSGDFSLVINPGLITQYLEQNGRLKGE